MAETSIAWTERTWNPLRGCTEISPGCAHCYAADFACRFNGPGRPYEGLAYRDANGKAHWTGKVRLVPEKLSEPLRWKKPCRVFVNSMSDLFHEDVPDEFIDQVFAVMSLAPQHTFQVLTKRAGRMQHYLSKWAYPQCARCSDYGQKCLHRRAYIADRVARACGAMRFSLSAAAEVNAIMQGTLPNVWLGVSVEDQQRADERIPLLAQTPAAVRWLSCEPLLGPVDLTSGLYLGGDIYHPTTMATADGSGTEYVNGIDWVVIGGESGHNARSCNAAWVRSLVQQCQAAGVACFVKQLGSKPILEADPLPAPQSVESLMACGEYDPEPLRLNLRDPKGGGPSEWPEYLRVRQYPEKRARDMNEPNATERAEKAEANVDRLRLELFERNALCLRQQADLHALRTKLDVLLAEVCLALQRERGD